MKKHKRMTNKGKTRKSCIINKILFENQKTELQPVIVFGLRFAFFTHISGKKRTVSKYVR